MEKVHTLEDFYLNSADCLPENLRKDVGHFNVFKMEDYIGKPTKSVPYSRKDYYKISLIIGNNVYHYADKSIEIKSAGISFANPMIPYKIERIGESQRGYFCVFTEAFLNQIPNIKEYPIFKPGSFPIYNLDEDQIEEFRLIFEQMSAEINVDYAFKYDFLRALVQQVIHKAMRLSPNDNIQKHTHSANNRITSLFVELLERQFPIESPLQRMKLRIPADFAGHLSIHINHLNRALKTVTGKTTSQLIQERVLQESQTLLKHTDWNIAEIGYAVGFDDPSHFTSFFRRSLQTTPKLFREI
ncbi:helix-turn-helix domain-containing protein [Flectobacillus sp. DC10W]|uniref:Helix-turn-helix domain-containing protein n=1 Tax=Flectobacillus longus TaxID=2984207 RepID=A0ABT6YK08_9BACT|nr:AraC family transcriptional regulator [Flectobacillus longus]MDI9863913.1 helix-turn-helix domain-containing protein [Flectobacillus longus]